ncbi:MAG: hypothetical protein MUF10_18050 [Thermoanaerobaculaceae bacterium]|jgi:hypothetical protein|nr:hypothetical protein [Thermoanaerobaculaceae bacterium]
MMQRLFCGAAALTILGGLGTVAAQPAPAPPPPDPKVIVERSCQAAGGMEAFNKLGTLGIGMEREEITQDGKTVRSSMGVFMATPGPIPGRFEMPEARTVAGDDGSGGWALIEGRPDQRPSTAHMVRRTISSHTFSLLLPFSLNWEGIVYGPVTTGSIAGKPVWRVQVELPRVFFASPQMSRIWWIDFDQKSYAVVQAISPATDLGKGVTSDGMLLTQAKPVKVGGVWLPGEEKAIGLDEQGNQKAHTRTKWVKYRLVTNTETGRLFENPIPPAQRPKPPQMQPPVKPPASE